MSLAMSIKVGLAAAGVGFFSAAVADGDRAAYDGEITSISSAVWAAASDNAFARADLNDDEALDVDEFRALARVSAELARLNGFIALEVDGEAYVAPIAVEAGAPAALTRAERLRIDAVARRDFHLAAGDDQRLDRFEHRDAAARRFRDADANRDGVLRGREIDALARAPQSIKA
ncbi:MAG: hypothetical protein ACFB00_13795 [Parvularculaceae bacterium]